MSVTYGPAQLEREDSVPANVPPSSPILSYIPSVSWVVLVVVVVLAGVVVVPAGVVVAGVVVAGVVVAGVVLAGAPGMLFATPPPVLYACAIPP